ncbi:Pol protein [Phytophthora palmivora]|uniref:Pol protein n=1 Tax=Phytophthora palmivora TaxID=4796 RepID=A0A2P4YM10_9STRA|nr:Pol protein [Phytophthora palmivora]
MSFFAEYNFRVEYKPGKLNVPTDALSRRPDYEQVHVSRVTTDLYDRIRLAYQGDENYTPLVQFLSDGKDAKVDRLSPRQRAQLHHYELADGLLQYRVDPGGSPRVVFPNDEDLKYDILLEAHDAPMSRRLGREKTYQTVSQTFWWPSMSKWVAHYVKTCETSQRVKPSGHASAPLQSPPVPADCCKSMNLDFVFGLPADDEGNTKGVWDALFHLLGTKLTVSTADHPRTDGQTERVNRVLEDTLRSICAEAPRLRSTTWYTHQRVPLTLRGGTDASIVSGGEARKAFTSQVLEIEPESLIRQLSSFLDDRLTLISRVRDAIVLAQDKQKEYSDKRSRRNFNVFNIGELVLLDTKNLPLNLASSVGSNKLNHRFIGSFAVLARHGTAYTIDLPKSMAMHPTFYMECLKRYHDPLDPSPRTEEGQGENSPPRNEAESSGQPELPVSKPVNETQAGTHGSHTKGMTVQSGKSSGKNHTRKPSGTSTPAAHKRASDHAPHGLERQSLNGVPLGRKPELGGQRARGGLESHDQERPHLDEGLLRSLACQPERQPDHHQSPDPKLRVQKDKAGKEPRTQTRARAPRALLDRKGEPHFHVDRVVRERGRAGKRQLLVKWRGYPSSQNSWEPEDWLRVDSPKAVEIWDQQPGRK